MATKRNIRMKNWDTSHLKVHVHIYILSLVRRPYFQFSMLHVDMLKRSGSLGMRLNIFAPKITAIQIASIYSMGIVN